MATGRSISTEFSEVGGTPVFIRRVAGRGTPTIFVHGVPTPSAQWEPFLHAVEGPALAPDLVGYGRSSKPRRFDYSMHGQASVIGQLLDALGIGEHNLVVHDWGSLALIAAQRRPELVRKLVIINAVPLLPGYRWHWVARLWRRRVVGELLNATTTRLSTSLILRQSRPRFRPMPAEFVEMIRSGWDRGTRRAIVRLYRAADPSQLEAAGAQLSRLSCPALVLWSSGDPYLPARFGAEYARRLPNAELSAVDDAGHWPWIDRPEVIAAVADFLAESA